MSLLAEHATLRKPDDKPPGKRPPDKTQMAAVATGGKRPIKGRPEKRHPSEYHTYDEIANMVACDRCETWCSGWDPCKCCKEYRRR